MPDTNRPINSLSVNASYPKGLFVKSDGFTLIELITVMVVVAVISALSFGFYVTALESYADTQERTRLVNRGRQAIEQITRQLRGAVPNSVRITNSGNCVEFLPLAGGGFYLARVPDADNGAAASASIATAPFRVDFDSARYVAIGALSSGELYGGNSLASLASALAEGTIQTNLTLSAGKVWLRNSSVSRFFLGANPQAFCLNGTELRYFYGYATPFTTTGTPSGSGHLLASGVSSPSSIPFALEAGTAVRNTMAIIDLAFSEGGMQAPLRQEVFIRNAP